MTTLNVRVFDFAADLDLHCALVVIRAALDDEDLKLETGGQGFMPAYSGSRDEPAYLRVVVPNRYISAK